MRVLAAYMLLKLADADAEPDAAAIKKVLSSVGVEGDDARIAKLLDEMKGKKLADVIEEGATKLQGVPSAGGAGGAAPAAGGSSAPAAEEKAPEPEPEPEEESDDDMGFGLFD